MSKKSLFTSIRAIALITVLLNGVLSQAKEQNILIVLSEADSITLKNGKTHPTGYYLSELIVPLRDVLRLGYKATIATPTGKTPTLDKTSDSAQFFKDPAEYQELKKLHATLTGIRHPSDLRSLSNEKLSEFDAVFFPGGHAPLTDLATDANVKRLLSYFHSNEKPTALICHGPAALLATRPDSKSDWQYKGYQMTGFSTAEEKQAEEGALGGQVQYYLDQALEKLGGRVWVGEPWKSKAVRDRELITGQNPQSDREMTRELLVALAEVRLKEAKTRRPFDLGDPGKIKDFSAQEVYEVTPFPSNWRDGFTSVFVGARKSNVSRTKFVRALLPHLGHAKRVFGPIGMRGYLVLSNGDYEIAFMNWPTQASADAAGSAPGKDAVLSESKLILDSLALAAVPGAASLKHPSLP